MAVASSDQQPLRGLFCTVAEKVPRKSDHVVNIIYNGNPWQLCLALLVCVLGNIAGRHLSILIMQPFLKAVGLVGSLSTTQPSSVATTASDQQPLRGLFGTVAKKVPSKSDPVVNIFYNGHPWQLCIALLDCVLGNCKSFALRSAFINFDHATLFFLLRRNIYPM